MHRRLIVSSLAVMLTVAPSFAEAPLGTPPTYTDRKLGLLPSGPVPNAAAILRRIWMPGLDEGFVPQGLSVVAGSVYVAAYKSPEGAGRGPCRLYRLDPQGGTVTGILDLPPRCGHAGGVAKGTPGHLWVADTRDIFEVRLDPPSSETIGTVVRHIRLGGLVRGSYAAGAADALWLGTYQTHGEPRLYKFPWGSLKPEISHEDAAASVIMPVRAQGAAFDAAGRLWVTRSSGSFGELVEINLESGAIGARFAFPVGTEDIGFDAEGRLWTVSEAGSKRWLSWSTFFPVVFQVDMDRLR
jgi:hypothetical protein